MAEYYTIASSFLIDSWVLAYTSKLTSFESVAEITRKINEQTKLNLSRASVGKSCTRLMYKNQLVFRRTEKSRCYMAADIELLELWIEAIAINNQLDIASMDNEATEHELRDKQVRTLILKMVKTHLDCTVGDVKAHLASKGIDLKQRELTEYLNSYSWLSRKRKGRGVCLSYIGKRRR